MKRARIVTVERVALTLDSIEPGDARLLAARLEDALAAAIAVRLRESNAGAGDPTPGTATQAPTAPLVTAARGEALVQAVAARLGEAIALQVEQGSGEEASWH